MEKNVDFTTPSITHSIYGLHNLSPSLQYFTAVHLKISSPGVTYVGSLMLKTLYKPQVGIEASDTYFQRLNNNRKMSFANIIPSHDPYSFYFPLHKPYFDIC